VNDFRSSVAPGFRKSAASVIEHSLLPAIQRNPAAAMFVIDHARSVAAVPPNRARVEKLAILASWLLGMDWLGIGVYFPAQFGLFLPEQRSV
jgi:hypothetical protein